MSFSIFSYNGGNRPQGEGVLASSARGRVKLVSGSSAMYEEFEFPESSDAICIGIGAEIQQLEPKVAEFGV